MSGDRFWSRLVEGESATLRVRPVLAPELDALRQFWVAAFGEDVVDEDLMRQWFGRNPTLFWMIHDASQPTVTTEGIVGGFTIIPLKKAAARLIESGEIVTAKDLQADHIVRESGQPAAVYIGGIVAKGFRARALALGALERTLRRTVRKGIPVYTRPISADGLRLVRQHGFAPVRPSAPDAPRGIHRYDPPRRPPRLEKRGERLEPPPAPPARSVEPTSRLGGAIVAIVLMTLLLVVLFALFSWTGLLPWLRPGAPTAPVHSGAAVLTVLGVTFTIACIVLLLAQQLNAVRLSSGMAKGIWMGFGVAVITASAEAYRTHITGSAMSTLKIDDLRLLDLDSTEHLARPLAIRTSSDFASPTEAVGFVAIVSGFARGQDGNPRLNYHFCLEHPADRRAHTVTGVRDVMKSPYVTDADTARLDSLFGDMAQRIPIGYVWAQREDIGSGEFNLHALISDGLTRQSAQATLPLVMRSPPPSPTPSPRAGRRRSAP